MVEQWLKITDFPMYDVSSFGNIRRNCGGKGKAEAGRILKPHENKYGYLTVALMKDGKAHRKTVHRLVCEAFHGPAKNMHAAHNDGIKTNNYSSNLRWATAKENCADKKAHGTMAIGDRNGGGTKLTEDAVREMRATPRVYGYCRRLSRKFGVSSAAVHAVVTYRTWTHVK